MVADIGRAAQWPVRTTAVVVSWETICIYKFRSHDDVCPMTQGLPRQLIAEQMLTCTCARLRKVTRRVTQMYDQALAPAGLTITQFGLLACLAARGELSIGELAEESVMDPTTLTRTLQPLERRKLIKIATARDDRRRRSVALSDAGRAAFRDALPAWRKAGAQLGELLGSRNRIGLDQSLAAALAHLATP